MGRKQKLRRERKAAEAAEAAEIATKPPLRFAVGDRVEVPFQDGYVPATVLKTWAKPTGSEQLCPYVCAIGTRTWAKSAREPILCNRDDDECIRAPRLAEDGGLSDDSHLSDITLTDLTDDEAPPPPAPVIKNDGSFLEMMRARLGLAGAQAPAPASEETKADTGAPAKAPDALPAAEAKREADEAARRREWRTKARRTCFECGRVGPLSEPRFLVCDACGYARYCGVECQRADWHDSHGELCDAMRQIKLQRRGKG
mmetsp:Transcript_4846/g.14371  ORF Transcript_4846/g.14371 Transcript_4846/m.14371 type:complete len:257 (+) Transcript_4846:425-1195(+)